MVNAQRMDWSEKLDDALWAYRTVYKTPIRSSPYHIVFCKACLLPVELEHQVYWTIKRLNLDPELAGRKRMNQLHELEDFRLHTYENAKFYNERMKRWHDKHIVTRTFTPGEKVLLFNSRLRLLLGKLRSKWSGSFEVVRMTQHGAVELRGEIDLTFLVNGQRVKHYFGVDSHRDLEAFELNDECSKLHHSATLNQVLHGKGIEEEEMDLTVAFHPDLTGKIVYVTRTKALDTSHGPVLSAHERQA
ncbi:uncharacterized protein LOC125873750 [Solanum stenotomum]|uniref:uncharacterized protein LOC125873750 n=1 Tax=Solanum stenotomum TaxID=172797 RepID=UPI0020D08F71|nr:uncharacterized protein LOC125873750 [Solanum stenotomum]